jgi:DNA-binding transcriptional ArsR family regulator
MPAELNQTFAALGDPKRLAVIRLLREKSLRSGDIAAALSMEHPVVSRHLRVLRKAGLVEEESLEHDARVRIYRLRQQAFSELRSWLDEVEELWQTQLHAFKAHAERKNRKRRK